MKKLSLLFASCAKTELEEVVVLEKRLALEKSNTCQLPVGQNLTSEVVENEIAHSKMLVSFTKDFKEKETGIIGRMYIVSTPSGEIVKYMFPNEGQLEPENPWYVHSWTGTLINKDGKPWDTLYKCDGTATNCGRIWFYSWSRH